MTTPLDWVEPLLAGELADEQVAQLLQWLEAEDANRLAFVQEVQLCQGIRRSLLSAQSSKAIQGMQDDVDAEVWAEVVEMAIASRHRLEIQEQASRLLVADQAVQRRASRHAAQTISPPAQNAWVIPIPMAIVGLAAAAFFIALLLWPKQPTTPQDTTPPVAHRADEPTDHASPSVSSPVARLVATHSPRWGADRSGGDRLSLRPDAQGKMSPGRYRLMAGDVQLRLDGGAVLLIEGPAEFDLRQDNTTRLVRGQLTVTVSSRRANFHLETPTAHFDGNQAVYGISVAGNGQTQAFVFSGEVAVTSLASAGSTGPIQCQSRQGVSIESPTSPPQRSEVAPEQFARELAALTGKPVTTGQADYHRSMPATVMMNQGPQSPRAYVVLESTNRLLEHGTAWAQGYPERPRVFTSSQGQVDSYLVVFDPDDESSQYKTTQFEITFPGRVLTVITENDDLSKSHGWYGNQATRYERGGRLMDGLESQRGRNENLEFRPDTIELSDDGRTMKVFLGVHEGADVFRVLIERPESVGSMDHGDEAFPSSELAVFDLDDAFIRPDNRAFTSPQLVAATISLKGELR